jgi:hypothetical protein
MQTLAVKHARRYHLIIKEAVELFRQHQKGNVKKNTLREVPVTVAGEVS